MQQTWWEKPTCILCDWWWAFLGIIVLLLAAYFTREYWLPAEIRPQQTPTPVILGTGDVQITMTWQSVNDLDLRVTDPAGEVTYYGNRVSASGGNLDVDANAACNNVTDRPVENVFWPSGLAPEGEYIVQVHYYAICQTEAATPFLVRFLIDGQEQVLEGIAQSNDDLLTVTIFTFDPGP
jgi:hypothetical protein